MQRSLLTAVFCLAAGPALALEGIYVGERDDFTFELTITEAEDAGADYMMTVAIRGTDDVPEETGVLRRDGDALDSAESADGPFNTFGRVAANGDIVVADAMSDAEFRAERVSDAP